MRLLTMRAPRGAPEERLVDAAPLRLGILLDPDTVLPVAALAEIAPTRLPAEIDRLDVPRLLAIDPDLGALRDAIQTASEDSLRAAAIPLADVTVGPAVPRPGKIICIGQNYMDHIREQGIEKPPRPILFAKFANTVVAANDPIRKPDGTHALDLEAELAVVIGRPASRVREEDALMHVAGYTVGNDVSARDWQGQKAALAPGEKGDGQWLRAKGADTFLPLGPVLVTADEVGDAGRLRVRSWRTGANGTGTGDGDGDGAGAGAGAGAVAGGYASTDADETETQMQNGTTADMIWSVRQLIAYISAVISLEPGDVIMTGTPNGVGAFRNPPVWLQPGDLVRVEVEAIGSLTNPVTDQEGRAPAGSPAARFMAVHSPANGHSLRSEDSVTP